MIVSELIHKVTLRNLIDVQVTLWHSLSILVMGIALRAEGASIAL
jgi:hypothetical protein